MSSSPARGPLAGGRVGLSEYTAQRLADLRARRADDESSYYKPAVAPRPSPTTTNSITAADSVAPVTSGSSYSSHRTTVSESAETQSTTAHRHQQQQPPQASSATTDRLASSTSSDATRTLHHQVLTCHSLSHTSNHSSDAARCDGQIDSSWSCRVPRSTAARLCLWYSVRCH